MSARKQRAMKGACWSSADCFSVPSVRMKSEMQCAHRLVRETASREIAPRLERHQADHRKALGDGPFRIHRQRGCPSRAPRVVFWQSLAADARASPLGRTTRSVTGAAESIHRSDVRDESRTFAPPRYFISAFLDARLFAFHPFEERRCRPPKHKESSFTPAWASAATVSPPPATETSLLAFVRRDVPRDLDRTFIEGLGLERPERSVPHDGRGFVDRALICSRAIADRYRGSCRRGPSHRGRNSGAGAFSAKCQATTSSIGTMK